MADYAFANPPYGLFGLPEGQSRNPQNDRGQERHEDYGSPNDRHPFNNVHDPAHPARLMPPAATARRTE